MLSMAVFRFRDIRKNILTDKLIINLNLELEVMGDVNWCTSEQIPFHFVLFDDIFKPNKEKINQFDGETKLELSNT